MTFFRQLQGDPIAWIFTLISAFYFISGLGLLRNIWQRREEFAAEPLQPWKKNWAERASFLLAVPPGVFIHELFHALSVWAFGGEVMDVGYGFYWGYVAHQGFYTGAQQWFISLSGTLGTLLYGFALWLLLRNHRSSAWRYFGLRSLHFHLWYALLYYPLFTLFTFIGDWRTIYNFAATPLLSGATLLVHLASLGLFWWSDRRGWYEMPAFQSSADEENISQLQEQALQNPADDRLQLQMIEALRQSGATSEARRELNRFLARRPRSAEGHLIMAFMENENRRHVSRRARDHAQEALRLGLQEGANMAAAHALLADYFLQVEKWDDALRHLDQAVAASHTMPPASRAHLHYLRALTQRRRNHYQLAQQEINQAISLAQQAGQDQAVTRYTNERELIMRHWRG